jgi:hypothetical protein
MNHRLKLILCGLGGLVCALVLAKWLLAGALLVFGAAVFLITLAMVVLGSVVVVAIVMVPPLFGYAKVATWLKRPGELGFLGDAFLLAWIFFLSWLLSLGVHDENTFPFAHAGHGPHESSVELRREVFANPADYSAKADEWFRHHAATSDNGVDANSIKASEDAQPFTTELPASERNNRAQPERTLPESPLRIAIP